MSTDERDRLLVSARQLAVELGPRALTMEALALRSGLPLDTVARYFAHENDVLLAIALVGTGEQRDQALAAIASAPEPDLQLAAFVRSLIRTARDYAWLFEIRTMPEVGIRASGEYAAYLIEIHGALAAAASPFAPDEEEAFELVLRLIAVAIGLAEMREAGMLIEREPGVDPAERHADLMVAAILRDARSGLDAGEARS